MALSGDSAGDEPAEDSVPVRIGWQIPAATQAQLVQVLKRTDVLDIHGLKPRLIPFSFGTPQIEAALAGKLDVVFAGDQPAINLVTRGGKWKIVAALFADRIAIMVPSGSPIQRVEELRAKTVGIPFGSSAHRVVIVHEQQAGLNPDTDFDNRDIDILEIRRLVQAGGTGAWGDVDAVAVWEPTVSDLERQGLARSLTEIRTLGVVAMSDEFLTRHPEASVQFLVALVRAWHYYSEHAARVRQWYLDDAQLGYTAESLADAADVDPNFGASSPGEIDLSLTDENLARLARAAAWAKERGATEQQLDIRTAIDQRPLNAAMKAIDADRFEEISVIMPTAREAPLDTKGGYFFDAFPLWGLFAAMILTAFLAIEGGHLLGRWRLNHENREPEGPIGTAVGAVLGLLAFVIALTFAAAHDRFDARKRALLDEVNAIGTAYLRADILPEPDKTTSRALLRDYVEARLNLYREFGDPDRLTALQARTSALQSSLWSHAEAQGHADPHSLVFSLFTESLNDVFDLNTTRVVLGAEFRIPFFVWCALGLVSLVAMVAVGFQFGLSGKRSLAASLSLSVTFALVILLIFDLDRPGAGLIDVNQRPMYQQYQSMAAQP